VTTLRKIRRFITRKTLKNVFLMIFPLVMFDVLVAFLGGSYLSENIGTFLGKSKTVILSDLLFEEGAVIFAIGAFVAFIKGRKETKQLSESTTEATVNAEQSRDTRINSGVFLIIVGVILIGLSIAVGTLLP